MESFTGFQEFSTEVLSDLGDQKSNKLKQIQYSSSFAFYQAIG